VLRSPFLLPSLCLSLWVMIEDHARLFGAASRSWCGASWLTRRLGLAGGSADRLGKSVRASIVRAWARVVLVRGA